MRRIVLVMVLILFVILPISVSSDNMIGKKITFEAPVKLNGKYLSVNAIGLEGTTYIPVRAAFESLDAEVDWDAEAGEVIIELPKKDEKDTKSYEPQDNEAGDIVEYIENTDVEKIQDVNDSEETESSSASEQDLLDKITELSERITATKNANFFTQKAIDEYLAMLENDELSQTRRDTIQERIAKSQEIIEKNNQIIADLEAEIAKLEAEFQK